MAVSSIPSAPMRADIELVWCTDSEGRPIGLPASTAAYMRSRGITTLATTILLDPEAPATPWLTVSEAARAHLEDVPPFEDDELERELNRAKAKISTACKAGHIDCTGSGHSRRIDPASFNEWRIQQRNKSLRR